jgi:hypothetical protein
MPQSLFPKLNFTKFVSKTIPTNPTFPPRKSQNRSQLWIGSEFLFIIGKKWLQTVALTHTPRSRALCGGFCGALAAVLS